MSPVPPCATEYRLLWRDGFFLRFPTLLAVARFAREHGLLSIYGPGEIGLTFGKSQLASLIEGQAMVGWKPFPPHIVCRSEHGDPVAPERLCELLRGSHRPWYWRVEQRPAGFRCEPVPGVHKRGGYRYFRRPKTNRDLKHQNAHLDDLADLDLQAFKVARDRDVPTSWDDIPRHVERNWKRFRKTQYRQ